MKEISELEIEEIVKGFPGGFFIYYAGGNEEIIYANREAVYLFGCETMDEFREYTHNSFRGMVHPEDLEWVEKSIADQLEGNPRNFDYVEYRIIAKDGTVKWIEDFGHYVNSAVHGEVFYVFITDITEKMKENLKQKKEMMDVVADRELLQKVLACTVYSYMQLYLINLKDNYYRMIYPDAHDEQESGDFTEAIERHITAERIVSDEVPGFRRLLQPGRLQTALREKDSQEYRYRRKWEDGRVEWCVMVFTVGERENGVPVTITMGVRSIEQLIQRENKQRLLLESAFMRARQASEAKTIFLANMSHDIRTPMNAIVGFAELGLRHGCDGEKMRNCLEKILDSSHVLLRLIDDLLDMSRIGADRLQIEIENCDLLEIMSQVSQMVQKDIQDKRLSYQCDFSGIRDRTVRCDFTRVEQVLYNLLSNAVKFTPQDGSIHVRVRQYESLSAGIENFEFVVQDTGIGISPEFLEKIFLPFEREKNTTMSGKAGVGLGLPLTKNIVELMNGSIHAESQLGQGSTFTVCLPLQIVKDMDGCEEAAAAKDGSFSDLAGRRVLLVEDNEINREMAKELLEEYHLQVDEAEDGDVALEMLKASPEYYDIVLMDIQMPRMNGYQAAMAIREQSVGNLSRIPIIALSANAFEEDKRMAFASGMNWHLPKPMDIEKVLGTMEKLLSECE